MAFYIDRWELDELDTRPPYSGAVRRVRALRLWVARLSPAAERPYLDIVAQTLIDQVLPWLQSGRFRGRRFALQKLGEGPASRWQLAVGADSR